MPCFDGRENERIVEPADYQHLKRLEAVLCAVVRARGIQAVLDSTVFEECGVSKDYVSKWWARHIEEDNRRYRQEQETAKRKSLRASALNKLTAEELAALGIKSK